MSKQTINIGASPNDGTGTPLRTSFDYTNQNFTELYTAVGPSGNNIVVPGNATITGAATVGTTLGVTGVSTLTGNAFANGSATVAGGTPGAFANAALTINNRGGVSDLSLIALGYRPNGTVLNGAAYIGFITTSGSGNVLGDLIFGTRSVTTDTAPTERYRIDSTGISTWSVSGTTAMTLNSTGLGIGGSPAYKLDVVGPVMRLINSAATADIFITDSGTTNGNVRLRGESNALKFITGGGVSATIDSSGNVGIGVTPSAWTNQFIAIEGGDSNSQSAVSFQTNANAINLHSNSYYSSGYKYKFTGTAGQYALGGNQHEWYIAPSGTAGDPITFTQAMTLDASGNLLVGVTSALASGSTFQNLGSARQVLTLKGNDETSYTLGIWSATTTGDNFFAYFGTEASTTVRGSVTYNRAGGLVAYNTTSDYRAKDIIGHVSNSGSLIDSLKVYVGKMKGATIERPMLIAHEAQEVAPYAVTGTKDEVDAEGKPKYQQMDASALVPLLIAEIQSLRARVQTLEAR